MPDITHGPRFASRIEFSYLASHAHVGAWWENSLYHLDLFDNGQWSRLFSKPGYSSIPQFITYCLSDLTPSETDNEATPQADVPSLFDYLLDAYSWVKSEMTPEQTFSFLRGVLFQWAAEHGENIQETEELFIGDCRYLANQGRF
jgi:hypothetical protein